MNYFDGCTNMNEAKIRFRELAKKYHPDTGGDAKIFSEISNQYDSFTPTAHEHTNSYQNSWKSTSFNQHTNPFNKYNDPEKNKLNEELSRYRRMYEDLMSDKNYYFKASNDLKNGSLEEIKKLKKQNKILTKELNEFKQKESWINSIKQDLKIWMQGEINEKQSEV